MRRVISLLLAVVLLGHGRDVSASTADYVFVSTFGRGASVVDLLPPWSVKIEVEATGIKFVRHFKSGSTA